MPLLGEYFQCNLSSYVPETNLSPQESKCPNCKNTRVHILLETSENPVSGPRFPGFWCVRTAVVLHWSRVWGWTQILHESLHWKTVSAPQSYSLKGDMGKSTPAIEGKWKWLRTLLRGYVCFIDQPWWCRTRKKMPCLTRLSPCKSALEWSSIETLKNIVIESSPHFIFSIVRAWSHT